MIGYAKCFDKNQSDVMSFKVINQEVLKKYTKIWEKISSLIGKEFASEPVSGDNNKYINTKIKSYGDKINANFQGKEIPKENASYKSLSLTMIDSVIRVNKRYYSQALLGECKYEIKKNKSSSDNKSDN